MVIGLGLLMDDTNHNNNSWGNDTAAAADENNSNNNNSNNSNIMNMMNMMGMMNSTTTCSSLDPFMKRTTTATSNNSLLTSLLMMDNNNNEIIQENGEEGGHLQLHQDNCSSDTMRAAAASWLATQPSSSPSSKLFDLNERTTNAPPPLHSIPHIPIAATPTALEEMFTEYPFNSWLSASTTGTVTVDASNNILTASPSLILPPIDPSPIMAFSPRLAPSIDMNMFSPALSAADSTFNNSSNTYFTHSPSLSSPFPKQNPHSPALRESAALQQQSRTRRRPRMTSNNPYQRSGDDSSATSRKSSHKRTAASEALPPSPPPSASFGVPMPQLSTRLCSVPATSPSTNLSAFAVPSIIPSPLAATANSSNQSNESTTTTHLADCATTVAAQVVPSLCLPKDETQLQLMDGPHSQLSKKSVDDDQWAYRQLLHHVKSNLKRWEQARVLWALATLRPSLFSLWSSLGGQDWKALQGNSSPSPKSLPSSEESNSRSSSSSSDVADRSLAELCLRRTVTGVLAPMIHASGTPTCIWRGTRGGELVLAGDEFCDLVRFPRSELLGTSPPDEDGSSSAGIKQSHGLLITDLMDSSSLVEYWEGFASICQGVPYGKGANERPDSLSGRCTLINKDGLPVPCAYWFTIKRDLFEDCALVVGNFLPVGR